MGILLRKKKNVIYFLFLNHCYLTMNSPLRDIYIATDGSEVIEELKSGKYSERW